MKIAVFITSGDFKKWQEIIRNAARDGVCNPKLELVRYPWGMMYGEMQLNGYKDFLKLVEFLDTEVIIMPKHRHTDGDKYDMVIKIYDDYRE